MLICCSEEAIGSFIAHCDVAACNLLMPIPDFTLFFGDCAVRQPEGRRCLRSVSGKPHQGSLFGVGEPPLTGETPRSPPQAHVGTG